MAQSVLTDVLQHLRCVWAAKASRDLTDSQLLQRFLDDQDEAAFAVLMQRHGPMVLGVCRRLTGDAHLAEDTFQGTFIVLARRARSIRKKSSLASWLYGVAQHIALRARTQVRGRQARERRLTDMPKIQPVDEPNCHELQGILDEEIGQLPERLRAPLVLCYLESKSHEEAARELRCPKSTLTNRLNRARELLHKRLTRRGVTLSAAALVSAMSTQMAAAAVTARLTLNTVKAAMGIASGVSLTAVGLSARAVILAQEGMKATMAVSTKAVALIVVFGLTVGGAGLAGYGSGREQEAAKPPPPAGALAWQAPVKKEVEQKKDSPALDLYGDPLPEGAVARLGTVRWRHEWRPTGLAFSLDGKHVISADSIPGVSVWDRETGRRLHVIPGTRGGNSVIVTPGGKGLATRLRALYLFEIATGKVLHQVEASAGAEFYQTVISQDGKVAATAGEDAGKQCIFVWDSSLEKIVRRLDGHEETIWDLAFSPDGKKLSSGDYGGNLILWDIADGRILHQLKKGHADSASCVAFLPDGKTLVSAGADAYVRFWDVESGKRLNEIKPAGEVDVFAFSPDGKWLAVSGVRSPLSILDTKTWQEVRKWDVGAAGTHDIAFSPDGKCLGTVNMLENAIRLWDTATGKELVSPNGHTGMVRGLAFDSSGKTLRSLSVDCKVLEWDLATGRLNGDLMESWPKSSWHFRVISEDGRLLARRGPETPKGENPKDIQLLDLAAKKEIGMLRSLVPLAGGVPCFNRDGNLLASNAEDGLHLWDVATQKELGHAPDARAWAFSDDSALLAVTGTKDHTIRLLHVPSCKEMKRWKHPNEEVFWLGYSSDGRSIVSVSRSDNRETTRFDVWDTQTGVARFGIEVGSYMTAYAISPTCRQLAVYQEDRYGSPTGKKQDQNSVHLYDIITGELIRKFDGSQGSIYSMAFSPNGRTLATGGTDTTILLWDMAGAAGSKKPGALSAKELENHWRNLNEDANKADRAIWDLVLSPGSSLPLLKNRMESPPPADPKEIAGLINALVDKSFAERQRADLALEKLGDAAEAAVRKHLQGDITPEVRQRLDQFVKNRDKDVIRKLRAIEVLELIGNAEARQLLETIARDAPNPRVSEAAAGALVRLKKRA